MCSSTRGPAIMPSLVTWPTSTSTKPRRLASRISSCAAPRTWLTVPGALSSVSRYIVWIESMTTRSGASSLSSEAAMSRTLVAAASCTGASRDAEPLGAQADLVDRLLAGDIGGARLAAAAVRRGDRGGGLQQQGRFADAGIAADQDRRARHQPAAADAVELGDAGAAPRRQHAAVRVSPTKSSALAAAARSSPFGAAVARQFLDQLFQAPQPRTGRPISGAPHRIAGRHSAAAPGHRLNPAAAG